MCNTLPIPKSGAVSWEQVNDLLNKLLKNGSLQQGRAWDMIAVPYETGQRVTRQKNCFAVMFTNIGDTVASVNNMIIFPSATPTTALGDSRAIAGHIMDIYKGKIVLAFQGGGANPRVEIVQLFYMEGDDINAKMR